MLSHPPVCIDDIREIASPKLDRNARCYYFSGAEEEQSLKDNINAFKRYNTLTHYKFSLNVVLNFIIKLAIHGPRTYFRATYFEMGLLGTPV